MDKMKRIGIQVSFLMGITLSFFLSFTGVAASGHFSLPGWLISFGISAVISLVIGLFIPMKRILDNMTVKRGMEPGKLSTRCVEALVSNLIYTPIITIIMSTYGYVQATKGGAKIPYGVMLGKSLIVCLIIIFFIQPLIMKFVFNRNGLDYPPKVPPGKGRRGGGPADH